MPWYVDLYDWAERLERISTDPVLKERCRAVTSAVTQAVRASKKLRGDRRRHGILILLPGSSQRWRTEQINEFDLSTSYYDLNFARDTRWDEFLDELFGQ